MSANGGEWRTDVALGRNSSIVSEHYQPLDAWQMFFVAPQLQLERNFIEVFVDRNRVAEYVLPTALGALDIGANVGRYGEVRLGLFGGAAKPELNNGARVIEDTRPFRSPACGCAPSSTSSTTCRFRARATPRDSSSCAASSPPARTATTTAGTHRLLRRTRSATTRSTCRCAARGRSRAGGEELCVAVPWGGFLQQSGYRTGQLLNRELIYGRVVYPNRLFTVPLFEGMYAGVAAEVGHYGRPLVDGNPHGTLLSGAAFLALDSPLGPSISDTALAEAGTAVRTSSSADPDAMAVRGRRKRDGRARTKKKGSHNRATPRFMWWAILGSNQ